VPAAEVLNLVRERLAVIEERQRDNESSRNI
jgi:hypothetical protein